MRAPTSANQAIQTQSERPTHDEDDELEEEEKRRCGAKYRGDVATHEGPVAFPSHSFGLPQPFFVSFFCTQLGSILDGEIVDPFAFPPSTRTYVCAPPLVKRGRKERKGNIPDQVEVTRGSGRENSHGPSPAILCLLLLHAVGVHFG